EGAYRWRPRLLQQIDLTRVAHSHRTWSIQTLPPAISRIPKARNVTHNTRLRSLAQIRACGGQQAAASASQSLPGGLPSIVPFSTSHFPLPFPFHFSPSAIESPHG